MRWAVILAGGSGSRFWPLSSGAAPKQVLPLLNGRSTAEAARERLAGIIDPARILLVTGPVLAAGLTRLLDLPAANVLIEPAPKSTGPALLWGSHEIHRRDPGATVLSTHADWAVPDAGGFRHAATKAMDLAERTPSLVTVGVRPTRPETGYGYISPGEPLAHGWRVRAFHEKPTAAAAQRLIDEGARWNSGLFAWRAHTLRAEIETVTPELAGGLQALDHGDVSGFFDACRPISIDVGLLERSRSVAMVAGDFAWDDVGTWEALRRIGPIDDAGNTLVGPVTALDSSDVVAWSSGTPVVLAWVRDLVVVEANGRILVMDRRRAADLKLVLDRLPPAIADLGGTP